MYDHMMDKMVEQIEMSQMYTKVKYVYGPARGGLPIAVHLSHHLSLEFASDYEFHEQFTQDMRERTLIVDDVCDTGETLKDIGGVYNYKPNTAVLFLKNRSVITPDFWIEINDQWIIFPWESLNEKPNREGYEDE
jgi:hypoxanthine phosphoribosyltransferase